MKRFYSEAAVARDDGGWTVRLDGRPIRTPLRAGLVVPTEALAGAIAAEWGAQGKDILPATMPLTGLANAAIDRIAPARDMFIDQIAAYGDGDVLLYRAAHPEDLVQQQIAAWNPILDWAERRYGVEFVPVIGVMHRPQPSGTLAALRTVVAAFGDFGLAAMQQIVSLPSSLVAGLAVAEGAVSTDAAWDATHLDELYQVRHWGEDSLATQAREARRAAFMAAVGFLVLCSESKT